MSIAQKPSGPMLEECGVGAGIGAFIVGLLASILMAQGKEPLDTMAQPMRFFYTTAGNFVDISSDLSGGAWFKASFVWVCIGAVLGVVAPFVPFVVSRRAWSRAMERQALEERGRAKEAEARRAREQVESEKRRREYELQKLQKEFAALPRTIADHYSASLSQLDTAVVKLDAALGHRQRSAYTPFWGAVETGLVALNEYRLGAERIHAGIQQYGSLRKQLQNAPELKNQAVGAIPNELSKVGHSRAAGIVADRFMETVYEAQTDFHFASIYEQRRTTAAVIAGFSSLQDAVDRLGDEVRSGNAMIVNAVDRQSVETTGRQDRSISLLGELTSDIGVVGFSNTLGREIVQMNDNLKAIESRLS